MCIGVETGVILQDEERCYTFYCFYICIITPKRVLNTVFGNVFNNSQCVCVCEYHVIRLK